jgi:hypothetical protein
MLKMSKYEEISLYDEHVCTCGNWNTETLYDCGTFYLPKTCCSLRECNRYLLSMWKCLCF